MYILKLKALLMCIIAMTNFSAFAVENNPAIGTQNELLFFTALWCGPCKMMDPILEELKNKYAGKILFQKIDVDEHPDTAARNGIQSVPTLLYIQNGKPVARSAGVVPKERIVQQLNNLLVTQ